MAPLPGHGTAVAELAGLPWSWEQGGRREGWPTLHSVIAALLQGSDFETRHWQDCLEK